MKKKYEKPVIHIEDMTVNCFMCGSCSTSGGISLNYNEDTCTFTDPESYMTFFSDNCDTGDGWGANIVNPNPHSPYAQVCYHRPLDTVNFFSS